MSITDERFEDACKVATQWNAECPVGAQVRYWPGVREGAGVESTTRSRAWALPSGAPVVMVDGYSGGIFLTHVEVAG